MKEVAREIKRTKNKVCRERNSAASSKKLQMLSSITDSHAHSKASIILEATKYLEELKRRVERINQNIAMAQNSTCGDNYPVLRVDAQDKGFLIRVWSERCCRGLLVFILEAFEELGLDVLQARVSCSECFHLEAVGIKDDQGSECLDVQHVKQAVSQAIQSWSTTQVNEQQ